MTASTAGARSGARASETVVLHAGGQFRASEKAVAEAGLARHRGVVSVEANPVAQTATVRYDPAVTSVQELRRATQRCGYECAGCNAPGCLCDPLHEPAEPEHGHDAAAVARAYDPAGHGEGGHGGHSMDQMARQMRNRFVVALVFTLAILAWSSIGKSLIGHYLATPAGLDRNIWQLLLSLPALYDRCRAHGFTDTRIQPHGDGAPSKSQRHGQRTVRPGVLASDV